MEAGAKYSGEGEHDQEAPAGGFSEAVANKEKDRNGKGRDVYYQQSDLDSVAIGDFGHRRWLRKEGG